MYLAMHVTSPHRDKLRGPEGWDLSALIPVRSTKVGTTAFPTPRLQSSDGPTGFFSDHECGRSVPAGGSGTVKVSISGQRNGKGRQSSPPATMEVAVRQEKH
jgi:hypothetical protein